MWCASHRLGKNSLSPQPGPQSGGPTPHERDPGPGNPGRFRMDFSPSRAPWLGEWSPAASVSAAPAMTYKRNNCALLVPSYNARGKGEGFDDFDA